MFFSKIWPFKLENESLSLTNDTLTQFINQSDEDGADKLHLYNLRRVSLLNLS